MKYLAPLVCLFLIACAPQASQSAASHTLVPYATATASITPSPDVIVIAETPVPTPTPFTYTVQSGDTLSTLAEKFKISLDDLQAANPDVSPNSLSIGTVLLIPSESGNPGNAPTPTPMPVPVTQTSCHPTADRGMWCFALVQNDSASFIENVSAQITLIDSSGTVLASGSAYMPLDILPPNSSLPVYVFFEPEIPAGAKPQVQILTAIRLDANDPRYLHAAINNTSAQIDWEGHYAQVSGQVSLPAESKAATQIWVAAVAYDKDGGVVGVKRWEGGEIQPGASINFNFAVASLGAEIDAVEFAVEARP